MVAGGVERAALRCLGRLEDDAQDPGDRLVQHGLVQPAAADRFDHGRCPPWLGAGHLQVETALQGRHPIMHRAPVGDDQPFEAPLVFEDVDQQLVVLGTVGPVELVVGAHHRPGLSFLHRGLEGGQVDLPQGALVHLGIDGEPLELLVVGRVVFRGPNPFALHAANKAGCHLPER